MSSLPEYVPPPESVPASRRKRAWLAVEFVVLFLGGVGLYALAGSPGSPLLPMAVLAIAAFVYLRRRPGFDRRNLGRPEAVRPELASILGVWAAAAVIGIAGVALLAPDRLFDLPRERPVLWLAVLVFYPLVSVYRQEIVFRRSSSSGTRPYSASSTSSSATCCRWCSR